ncbi:MAG: PAS domain S-box protein [Planctomycetota bacterium]|jgi:PAS domain S-box-containing protein
MIIKHKYCWSILTGMLLVLGLWTISLYNYLLFHGIAELFSIVVACGIFMFAWNSRQFIKNSYFLFIGIAYLFVGNLDLVHTIAYKGMGVFPGYEANLSTQLWIAARYVEGVSLLIAPFFIGRKLKTNFVLLGYIIATAVLLGSILYWHIFPVCFTEGEGLTIFKKVSEYIISLVLLASVVALFNKRKEFNRNILRLLIASVVITIASELAFTFYVDAYGFSNLVGHYLKIISFYLIYIAVIKTGLARPYALFFRDIRRSEEELLIKDEAIASSITAIGITDLRGKIVYVNNSLVKMWGYDNDGEILGRFLPEFWEGEGVFETIEMLREEGTRIGEDMGKRRDGSLFHVHFSTSMIKDKTGSPVFMFGSFIDITSRKEAEEALKDSEEKFRTLVGNIPDAVWTTDRNGNTTFLSANILDIYGYNPEEIYANPKQLWFGRIHPDDVADVKRAFERFFETSDRFDIEYRIRHKNGHWIWLHDRSTAIYQKDGVHYADGVLTDVTERKKAEETLARSEERYRGIFDESIASVYVFDEKKNFINSNQAGLDLLGYSRDELLSMSIPDVDADPVAVLPAHEQLLSGGKIVNYEHQLRRKDGTIITVLNNSRPLTDTEGNVIGMQSTLIDITERKKAEEALRESEDRFRNIFKNAMVGLYRTTPDGRVLMANPAILQMLGYESFEELAKRNLEREGFEPSYPRSDFKERIETEGQVMGFESAWRRRDNAIVYIRESAWAIRDEFGNTLYYEGIIEDITERKQAQEALDESAARLQLATSATRIGHWDWDLRTNEVYFSPEWKRQIGYEDREIPNRFETWESRLHPDDWQSTVKALEDYIAGRQAEYRIEFRLRHKDDSYRWIYTRAEKQSDDTGKPCRLFGCHVDFTERKKAEELLKDSEARFRMISEYAPVMIDAFDSNGRCVMWNKECEKVFGWTAEEIFSHVNPLILLYPDPEVQRQVVETVTSKPERTFREWKPKRKDGSEVTCLWANFELPDGLIINLGYDITERKRDEEKIVGLAHILETSLNEVYVFDAQTLKFVQVNEGARKNVGYSMEELQELTPLDIKPEFSMETFTELAELLHNGQEEIVNYETIHERKNGSLYPVEVHLQLSRLENRPVFVAIVLDITERKQAELAVREMASFAELSPAPVLRVNSDGLIMSCNPALGELLGKNIKEETSLRSVLPDLSEIALSDCIREGLLLTHESYIRGRYFQFVFRGIPAVGLAYIYGSDITKRKQAEKALQISETNLVKAQEVARIGSWHLDLLENNLVWTDENYKIFGVSKGIPMTYEKFLEVVHPEDRDYVDKKWRAAMEGEPYDIEHRLLVDNEVKWVREKAELNFDEKGNATSGIGITQDITERKRAEKKLHQYQERLKALASELTIAEERERRRIAADLHDNVQQTLAFARIQLSKARKSASPSKLPVLLDEISESLRQTVQDTRNLIFDLSSPSMNEIGLAAAISEWLEQQIQKRHALKTEFIDECGIIRLDDNVRAILFRNVRELLTNVVKHAKASQVAVCLKRMGGCLEIIVRDNGVGFDYAVESGTQIGFGLFSIQERMADLGGSLEIESKPGKGCKIIMKAPLNIA